MKWHGVQMETFLCWWYNSNPQLARKYFVLIRTCHSNNASITCGRKQVAPKHAQTKLFNSLLHSNIQVHYFIFGISKVLCMRNAKPNTLCCFASCVVVFSDTRKPMIESCLVIDRAITNFRNTYRYLRDRHWEFAQGSWPYHVMWWLATREKQDLCDLCLGVRSLVQKLAYWVLFHIRMSSLQAFWSYSCAS